MKKNYNKILVIMIIVIIMYSVNTYGEITSISKESYLDSIIEMILERYNGEVTKGELYEGALRGVFDTLDKYSIYYSEEDLQNFMQTLTGEYEGIGVLMGQNEEYIIILKVFEDSPAEHAGLLPYDKIVSADGNDLIGKTTEEAASLIKGEAGTFVELGILRNNNDVFYINIKREKVEISPVVYSTFGDIGYIRLDTFSTNADIYIQKALEFMDEKNIAKIVLDLRNNPGGEVSQAIAISRNFVPEGLITTLHFKSDEIDDVEYYSFLDGTKYELAVLVNENTASASELVSGAIQDSNAGIVIGTQTYGKGKVQNIFPLLTAEAYKKYSEQVGEKITNGYDLILKHLVYPSENEILGWGKLTTGEYYTRDGRNIDGHGIDPDLLIANYELVNGVDIWAINDFPRERKLNIGYEGFDVLNLERFLTLLGYEIDTPDFIYDKKTFNAVAKFQRDSGLYPYGVCDFATQLALNKTLIEKLYEIDIQLKTAIDMLSLN